MANEMANGGGFGFGALSPEGTVTPPPAPQGDVILTRDEFEELKFTLLDYEATLARLLDQPLTYATVVEAKNKFDLSVFEKGDLMLVIDKELRKKKRFYGKINSNGVSEDGWVILEYPDGSRDRLNIGIGGQVPQVKILGKDDGMNVVIAHEGKLFQVHGLWGVLFKPSDTVKVDMQTKQIHEKATVTSAGDVAVVKSIVDVNHVEVEANGTCRVVINAMENDDGIKQEVEPGDKVMLDNTNTITVRLLERDGKDRFNLTEQVNTTWDDIAGLGEAKEALIEALELPYKHPDVYKFYNKRPPKGVLLFGPPGCGKTLCGKAAAYSLAQTHGKENFQSGFIYVKGPELLSKWVGQSEAEIRALFSRGREHYKKHGYPALLFIDEADAILPMRGSGKSSDVENTIVPQFLSEMDGLEESGVMVLLATNQPKRLDPAVCREGRVDRHVKVSRPTAKTAPEYFRLHMKSVPVAKGYSHEEIIALTINDLYNPNRVLYNITHKTTKYPFTLGDVVTGAMIPGIIDQATSLAMKRDLKEGGQTGVTHADLQVAVQKMHKDHAELNPTFDLEDFCDTNGINRADAKFERLAMKA